MLDASGMATYHIAAGKYRRYHGEKLLKKLGDVKTLGQNLADGSKLAVGFWQSVWRLRRLKPAVVFVKGGYVGLPVGLAAAFLGIPLVIHESDAQPGLANRVLSRYAKVIATGFPVKYYPDLPKARLRSVGNPVRQDLLTQSGDAKTTFELVGDRPVLLIIGGSSGASRLNQAVLGALGELCQDFEIIHVVGARDFAGVKAQLGQSAPRRYHYYDFLNWQMGLAYQAADLVVSRAGMNSVSEIAAFGLPAVVIPSQYIEHQVRNADILAAEQAALTLSEDRLSELPQLLRELSRSREQQRLLKKGLAKISRPDAAATLAKLIIEAAR
jgi:UDP-N-acetylglucosamine--N-acetylmuramyl-(pentapeptide) pyrophosphoryl-undecaprenol N-acetylglucosamine transferase